MKQSMGLLVGTRGAEATPVIFSESLPMMYVWDSPELASLRSYSAGSDTVSVNLRESALPVS